MKIRFYPKIDKVLIIIFLCLIKYQVNAQSIHLVKDINTLTESNPHNFDFNNITNNVAYAVLDSITYFGADDGVHGTGLWRSDGTEAGTYALKDSINPIDIVVCNGKLFFTGSGSNGLWVSDGTRSGTTRVLSTIPSGLITFVPSLLTCLDSTVYFCINGHSINDQLWKTDGTEQGTMLVKNFYDTVNNNYTNSLYNLRTIKNKLYFVALNLSNYRNILWVSNGTGTGTHVISNTLYDPGQMIARSSDNADSLVYFTASTSQFYSRDLYVTNGDSGVAQIANGFNAKTDGNFYGSNLVVINDNLYFIGRTDDSSFAAQSLYKYNINTANGVQLVKLVNGKGVYGELSNIYGLTEIDSSLFYALRNAPAGVSQLWKTDSAGNLLLKDSINVNTLINANGICYFGANDNIHGYELWKSDGTVSGTKMIKDINDINLLSSNPYYPTSNNNGKILFSANDGIHGTELWQTDGTEGNTLLVKDINQTSTSGSYPQGLIALNNKLLFSALNGFRQSSQVYNSDGTNSGTFPVSDSVFGNFNQYSTAIKGSELYFEGYINSLNKGLYKTNGTAGGTVKLVSFSPSFYISTITSSDSLIYFIGYNLNSEKYSLWRTDGTSLNTYVLKDNMETYDNTAFTTNGNTLYFSSNNGLWKSDGSSMGTVLIKSFVSNPVFLTSHDGTLYFDGFDGTGFRLWKSDGTSSGTIKITDNVSNPSDFFSIKGKLFFFANGDVSVYGNVGRELFTTDGTESGTLLVKDIHPGIDGTYIGKTIRFNGISYFLTGGANATLELWRSDGTAKGTRMVRNVGNGSSIYQFAICSGKLYFVADSTLWESDGTSQGTNPVTDNIFSGITLLDYNTNLTSVGNKLYFTATSYAYGEELYVREFSTLPVKLLTFTGALKKADGLLQWSTANEQNNNYFNLQRSTNGVGFTNIARVKGAGNTSQKTDYEYTDKNIVQLGKDKVYYRLQQVDQDGAATLSNIVVINTKAQPHFIVSPNPFKNNINLFATGNVDNAGISLADMNGKVLFTKRQNIKAGQLVQIESAALARGVYIITVENAEMADQIKIVKE